MGVPRLGSGTVIQETLIPPQHEFLDHVTFFVTSSGNSEDYRGPGGGREGS